MQPLALLRATTIVALAFSLPPALAGEGAGDAAGHAAGDGVEHTERVGAVTGDDVNVRAGPSVDYHDVGKLQTGDLVIVLGEDGEWSRLRVPGGVPVFVHGSLVEWEEGSLRGVVQASNVLMRPTPGQAYSPLRGQRLQRGAELLVLGVAAGAERADGPWLRVVPPDEVHVWVHSRYVGKPPPLPDLDRRMAAAAQIRIDTLSGGRTRAARQERVRRVREAYEAELSKLREILRGGPVEAAHLRAAAETTERAPAGDLRLRAVALERDLRQALEARVAAETVPPAPAPPETNAEDSAEDSVEAEAKRRAEADARREAERQAELERAEREKLERERREAEAKRRKDARGAPTAEGEVEREGAHLVLRVGSVTYRLRSRRYRLTDFAGHTVAVWGTRGSSDVLNVDFLELVSAR